MSGARLLKGIMTVGFWTLLSRVLGMAREVLLYMLIGAGPVLDAFVVAFRLPNMFRRFFAEGAFNAAFVPLFSKRLQAQDNPIGFASQAMGGLAFALALLTALALIFMPALVWLTAQGFMGDARFDMAVDYGRVMFPYIFLISLSALLSGALNAQGRFAMAAAAPVFLNIIIICALCLGWVMNHAVIYYLIWAVPIAGVAQLAALWRAAQAAGLPIHLGRPSFSPEMRQLVRIALPAALANGVLQINLLVGQLVASQHPGAVSWLYGADRLYQLPLGVVGIAVGIVLLPELSRRLQAKDQTGAKQAFASATEITLALSLPAAMALCVVPYPFVSALFEHGATSLHDAQAMALATAIYGLGLPAFVLQKLLQPLYFAREDTRKPFRFALVGMGVNAALAVGLMPFIGWLAAAIATSLSAWAMVGLLFWGARGFDNILKPDAALKHRLLRMCITSLFLGVALYSIQFFISPAITSVSGRIVYALFLVIAGAGLYLWLGERLKAFSLQEIKASFKKH
ncbi:MAG TPA: murein biosynthesis integral membrane protein MurJ [Rhodobacteraceae bacterium]|jgi:putative peptidoglycan lipid II flippase|nr:murein biosynthesis integral membrane protein MurJ [Paracoccaceae bacterium]